MQYVVIINIQSERKHITCGVAQGKGAHLDPCYLVLELSHTMIILLNERVIKIFWHFKAEKYFSLLVLYINVQSFPSSISC